MTHSPSISVIIPAYNAGHTLGVCLDSVLRQTLPPQQIVVVDDASDDNTTHIAEGNAPTVTLLHHKHNKGQGAARNTGLDVARGDYIAFLDADDYWLPGFLRACVTFLENHSECVAVSTAARIRRRNGKEQVWPQTVKGYGPGQSCVLSSFFDFWAKHDHVRTGTVLLRKAVVERAGPQRADLRISQDLEYWGYIATYGPWGFIPETLWVGTSGVAARIPGWQRKYRQRRAACPTVESWESRISSRLKPEDERAFMRVRGRLASGYAHSMILAGQRTAASHVVREYGCDMPRNRVTLLMKTGVRLGPLGWWATCMILSGREALKG